MHFMHILDRFFEFAFVGFYTKVVYSILNLLFITASGSNDQTNCIDYLSFLLLEIYFLISSPQVVVKSKFFFIDTLKQLNIEMRFIVSDKDSRKSFIQNWKSASGDRNIWRQPKKLSLSKTWLKECKGNFRFAIGLNFWNIFDVFCDWITSLCFSLIPSNDLQN